MTQDTNGDNSNHSDLDRRMQARIDGRKFETRCTERYDGMPSNNMYFQTLRYPLGDSQVLCWSERDAYVPQIKPDDTAPIQLPSKKDRGQNSPQEPVIILGEIIQPQQLVELKSFRKYRQGQRSSKFSTRKAEASMKAWLAGDHNVFWGIIHADDERWTRSTMQRLRTGAPSG
jgi:hypothetical protein